MQVFMQYNIQFLLKIDLYYYIEKKTEKDHTFTFESDPTNHR